MTQACRISTSSSWKAAARRNFTRRRIIRSMSSSSSKRGDEHEYSTNGGIVEGVWIFFRHGDRAPSRSLSPAHMLNEEANFWISRMPRPNSFESFMEFSRYFRPEIHPSNEGKFLDARRAPFGFLTHTGVEQTRENGLRLFNRYNRHGHHLPSRDKYLNGRDFLDAWDVQVYSTNYLRTLMSVQSFLDGLLGTKCYESLLRGETGSIRDRASIEDMIIPDHSSVVSDSEVDKLLSVQIRGRDEDTLNAFDRNPDLMATLVSDVIRQQEFQEKDGAAAPLAARLANILPGLARKKKNTSGFNAAPSGINWIEAADHFVCREAHNVEYSRFSEFEHDDSIEEILSAFSHQTKAHLAWRFRQWYKSPKLLASIAGPPLREIADQLKSATHLEARQRHPFTIYSCHDVTILALLYGIGADFLADDNGAGWRFWPSYASTLVFELVRVSDQHHGNSHVVRVLLNGKPVKSVDQHNRFWEGPGTYVGKGPLQMLLVEDFANVVTELERAGG